MNRACLQPGEQTKIPAGMEEHVVPVGGPLFDRHSAMNGERAEFWFIGVERDGAGQFEFVPQVDVGSGELWFSEIDFDEQVVPVDQGHTTLDSSHELGFRIIVLTVETRVGRLDNRITAFFAGNAQNFECMGFPDTLQERDELRGGEPHADARRAAANPEFGVESTGPTVVADD